MSSVLSSGDRRVSWSAAAFALFVGLAVGWSGSERTDALGPLQPSERRCLDVIGDQGDVALVNLTPVEAERPGDGQLVSSNVEQPPVASNVNFAPGTVDPNVALAPIGARRQVCFVNSVHASVNLVADHLGSIAAEAFRLPSASGAPQRVIDTRGGSPVPPAGRRCFSVEGTPGDAAIINLTPVEASQPGDGQLISSDVTNPPEASNVNFGIGTVDPNLAVASIGADNQVCFQNSVHATVELVADHLGSIRSNSYTPATVGGPPSRRIDTRLTQKVPPNGRLCFSVAGSPGDAAIVNITPVEAEAAGDGQLISSDVTRPPLASNVNYAPGTVDPNVAVARIGGDGQVCYVNSVHTSVHIVADHLGNIDGAAYIPAQDSGAPSRRLDTRTEDPNGSHLLDRLTIAPADTSVPFDRNSWSPALDADGDCQNTRAEVLIRDSIGPVTFTDSSNCVVATGRWRDRWTGSTYTQASDVEVDRTVALNNAHRSGGASWTLTRKSLYANDLTNIDALQPVALETNDSKVSRGPESWKPPLESSWCDYATDWATIKIRWDLTVTQAEYDALVDMLDLCDDVQP